ncbi:MAG: YchF/TatD family DNA exonuclease [Alphaproteobacteria bacterium]|nr:YchF/TatD family DNA exonuclease [Alphaproteobacteria bacterium]
MLIDSHVNLHHEKFDADRSEVIAAARAAGVGVMITICDRIENVPHVLAIAERDPDIYATIGAHPHYAKDHLWLTPERLIQDAKQNRAKVVGIGETGLDLHYGFSALDDQERVFRAHIEAARTLDLPLIVHTRAADDRTGDILEEEHAKGAFPLLMHCYTSGADLARRAVALGGYISFSGIMTFKNAADVRAIAAETPLDRVILETDCPYLAPVPFRGRRCEPAMVAEVYRFFCAERGIDTEEGAAIVADNVHRLFRAIPRAA